MLLAAFAVGLCCSPVPPQVWVVSDQPGAGVDFTNLQAAADAAAPGDILLIRGGVYLGLTLNGKGLDLVAESDAQVELLGAVLLTGIPADQRVLLRGLNVGPAEGPALDAVASPGHIWLEACEFRSGAAIEQLGFPPVVPPGGQIVDCPQVVLDRCLFEGANGINYGFFGLPSGGGFGLVLRSSQAVITGGSFRGGGGADAPHDEWWDGGSGGSGIRLQGSTLWAAGLQTVGGGGGWGDEDYDGFTGQSQCGKGGAGGHGIQLFATGLGEAPSQLIVRDHLAQPGSGGPALCAPAGAPGLPIATAPVGLGHTVTAFAGEARGFYAASPVRVGTNARLYFEGLPGDSAFVGIGLTPIRIPLPEQALPLLIPVPDSVLLLNPPDLTGNSITAIPVPLFSPSFEGATLFLQAIVLEGGATLQLAPASALTLLGLGF